MISVMKCVIIVHWEKVRDYGEDKVKQIFFWLNIVYPLYVLTMINAMKPDFLIVYDGISQANRCLGKSDMISSQNRNESASPHDVCDIDAPLDKVSFEYMVYIGRKYICWLHVILVYSNIWNVLEVLISCSI